MAERPIFAFVSSLVGGVITLVTSLIGVNTWYAMYSANGTTFSYSQWYVVISLHLTAIQGLFLMVAGAACGTLIIVGAVLQFSGRVSSVKRGSMLVLVGTIIGIPATSFGWILGGLMSVLGAALGLTWKSAQDL